MWRSFSLRGGGAAMVCYEWIHGHGRNVSARQLDGHILVAGIIGRIFLSAVHADCGLELGCPRRCGHHVPVTVYFPVRARSVHQGSPALQPRIRAADSVDPGERRRQ
jgi:hypothetical protein